MGAGSGRAALYRRLDQPGIPVGYMPRAAVSWKKLKKQQPAQPLFPRNPGYKKSVSSPKIGKYRANTSLKNRLN